MTNTLSVNRIESSIYTIRGKKVMLDRDLSGLYGVTTGALNQAVKRNHERFPEDFMFQLTREELGILKSQIVISSWGGIRKMPFAFTDYGVAMLSSVLRSDRAVQINIQIMRAFTRIRNLLVENKDVRLTVEKLERRVDKHDMQIQIAFNSLWGAPEFSWTQRQAYIA